MQPDPPALDNGVTLTVSRDRNIIAITSGPDFRSTAQLLDRVGFVGTAQSGHRLDTRDPAQAQRVVVALNDAAATAGIAVTTKYRPWIGDAAADIAASLPGRWTAKVRVLCLPIWQEAIASGSLWDDGELIAAFRTERIGYAAVLSGEGIDLLMIDQPGRGQEYLVGAIAPDGFEGTVADTPDAPRSVTLPADPGPVADYLANEFLSDYANALHSRRLSVIATALAVARDAERTWQNTRDILSADDSTGFMSNTLAALELEHRATLWTRWPTIAEHAPSLLDHLRAVEAQPASPIGVYERAALTALRTASDNGRQIQARWMDTAKKYSEAPYQPVSAAFVDAVDARNAEIRPVIRAWLEHGDTLMALARRFPPVPSLDRSAHPPVPLAGPRSLPSPAPAHQPGRRH
jgi:hypothetical protein